MDCWIITGHDVYVELEVWLEDASELHAAEVPLMEYAGGVQILIDGVNGARVAEIDLFVCDFC